METRYRWNDEAESWNVRFHLGSGINGNPPGKAMDRYLILVSVRFHLGSGINGNVLGFY